MLRYVVWLWLAGAAVGHRLPRVSPLTLGASVIRSGSNRVTESNWCVVVSSEAPRRTADTGSVVRPFRTALPARLGVAILAPRSRLHSCDNWPAIMASGYSHHIIGTPVAVRL